MKKQKVRGCKRSGRKSLHRYVGEKSQNSKGGVKSQSGREPRVHPERVAGQSLSLWQRTFPCGCHCGDFHLQFGGHTRGRHLYSRRRVWLSVLWGCLQTPAFARFPFPRSLRYPTEPGGLAQLTSLFDVLAQCIDGLTLKPAAFCSERNWESHLLPEVFHLRS